MTPRALVKGAGLRGPGQDIFPEAAKQSVRNIVLVDKAAQVFRNNTTDDGGGDFNSKWEPHGKPIAGRIDELGKRGSSGGMAAEQIDEATTHIVSLEPEADVTSNDRIEINGVMWTITASPSRTDAATTRLQVRELVL